jgi:hypothetical protein
MNPPVLRTNLSKIMPERYAVAYWLSETRRVKVLNAKGVLLRQVS